MESSDRFELIERLELFVENVSTVLQEEFVLNEHDFHASFHHEGDGVHVLPHLIHPWLRGPVVQLIAESSDYIPRRLFGAVRAQLSDTKGSHRASLFNLHLGCAVIDDMLYDRAYRLQFWLDYERLEQLLDEDSLYYLM